jgi:cellulose synthase/poly-beta-1,6-N-acetylglucosamine synthase-like glycosyltransferase
MAGLEILFITGSLLMWTSTFGYVLFLSAILLFKNRNQGNSTLLSDVAVVIPTLNDEDLILDKLADVQQIDYPHDRLTVVFVDGGSRDRTVELVRREIARGQAIRLICLDSTQGRGEQINRALKDLEQDVIVVTNVDSRLEPSCLGELVNVLMSDDQTAVVGATVHPLGAIIEERIYWRFLNFLWWLEGEVLSSASVCGVCYAFRRDKVPPFGTDAIADDINLALSAGAKGFRVRICRTARASEVRIPRTRSEFVQFRRRRGGAYFFELQRIVPRSLYPLGWRLARLLRLWHFVVTPKLGVGLLGIACVLLVSANGLWPVLVILAFGLPTAVAAAVFSMGQREETRWWLILPAVAQLTFLTLFAMLTLKKPLATQPSEGGPQ